MAFNKSDIQVWADRVWMVGEATSLDADARALANALVEKIIDNPEQAAHLIASLVTRDSDSESKASVSP